VIIPLAIAVRAMTHVLLVVLKRKWFIEGDLHSPQERWLRRATTLILRRALTRILMTVWLLTKSST
jgi:hypothetical protein